MTRRLLTWGLLATTLPLMAALCCYPRDGDLAAPLPDRATLLHRWRLERAACFCTAVCSPDSANRPFTLHFLADGRYERTGLSPAVESGTWDLLGAYTLVLTYQGTRQEFVVDWQPTPNGRPAIGDSLYLSTNSTTDCRRLVFSKLP